MPRFPRPVPGEVGRGRTPPQGLLEHARHDPHRCRRRVGRDPHQHDGVARVHDLGALDAEQHPRELLGDGLVRRPGGPGSPREGGKGGAQLAPGPAPHAPDVRQPQVRRVVGGAPHGDGGAEAVGDEPRDRPQGALGRTGGGHAPADRDGLADRPQLAAELLGTTDVVKGDRELARDGAQRLPAPRDRVDRRDDLEHPQALATGDERQHREHGARRRGELEPHRPAGDEHGPAARRPLATGLPQPGVRPRGAEPASGVGQRDLDVRGGDPQGGANPGWGRGDGLLLGLRRGERVAQGPQHRSLVLPGGRAGRAFDATHGGCLQLAGARRVERGARSCKPFGRDNLTRSADLGQPARRRWPPADAGRRPTPGGASTPRRPKARAQGSVNHRRGHARSSQRSGPRFRSIRARRDPGRCRGGATVEVNAPCDREGYGEWMLESETGGRIGFVRPATEQHRHVLGW